MCKTNTLFVLGRLNPDSQESSRCRNFFDCSHRLAKDEGINEIVFLRSLNSSLEFFATSSAATEFSNKFPPVDLTPLGERDFFVLLGYIRKFIMMSDRHFGKIVVYAAIEKMVCLEEIISEIGLGNLTEEVVVCAYPSLDRSQISPPHLAYLSRLA